MGPIEQQIATKLVIALNPTALNIKNESAKHAGHAGNPGGDETHFHISIQSEAFNGLSVKDRHKKVYDILAEEIPQIHALSLSLKEAES